MSNQSNQLSNPDVLHLAMGHVGPHRWMSSLVNKDFNKSCGRYDTGVSWESLDSSMARCKCAMDNGLVTAAQIMNRAALTGSFARLKQVCRALKIKPTSETMVHAARCGSITMIQKLTSQGCRSSPLVLAEAIKNRNVLMAIYLIRSGYPVDYETTLQLCLENGMDDCILEDDRLMKEYHELANEMDDLY